MTHSASWPALTLAILLLLGTDARATTCMQGPLEPDIEAADAIFSGQVTSVRYRRWFESAILCSTHKDGPRCGEKVARVAVDRVWKGDVEAEAFVYSEDGCYCLGGYFEEGERMVFMVVDPEDGKWGLGPIDYRTAFCGRNLPLDRAIEDGMIESFDAHFPSSQ